MKKFIKVIAVILIISLCGCGRDSSHAETPKGNETRVNAKYGKTVLSHYMTYVMELNDNARRAFYSRKLIGEMAGGAEGSEPHPAGYSMAESSSGDNEGYSVSILNEVTLSPDFSIDTYTYKLVNEDGVIKIDSITKTSSMELIGEEDKVYIRKDEEGEKKQVLELGDLPEYAVMQRVGDPEQKYPVPRDNFTSCGVNSDGDTLIVTTSDDTGSGCFVARVSIKEEEETLQQDDKMEGGQKKGGDGGQEGKDGQQKENKKTSTVKAIDLIKGCKCCGITYSPQFDMFLLGLEHSNGKRDFALYDIESGEAIPKYVPMLDGDELSSSLPYFVSEKEIVFNITPSESSTDDEKRYSGRWSMDIETGELEQIE